MTLYSQQDIGRIADEIRRAKDRGRPFALLMGAGCSITAGIPSAPELVQEINDKYAWRVQQLPEDRRQDYGSCMGKLTASERKDILKPHLDKARVNWANLAVASMLAQSFISRIMTFNFDQVLERACGICGHYPAVYDFRVSPSANLDHVVDGAIIHLHGQGYGLTMKNSIEETRNHAASLRPLIVDTLDRHPLLVIGYSGKSDQVFSVLEQCYQSCEILIWCGLDKEEPSHVKPLCLDRSGPSEYIGGTDSDSFLVKLAQQLECWPPLILFEPEKHLLNELEPVIDYPSELGGTDILKERRLDLHQRALSRESEADQTLIQLVIEGKYDEVIKRAGETTKPLDRRAVAAAYLAQGNSLFNEAQSKNDEALYEKCMDSFRAALKISPDAYQAMGNLGL